MIIAMIVMMVEIVMIAVIAMIAMMMTMRLGFVRAVSVSGPLAPGWPAPATNWPHHHFHLSAEESSQKEMNHLSSYEW